MFEVPQRTVLGVFDAAKLLLRGLGRHRLDLIAVYLIAEGLVLFCQDFVCLRHGFKGLVTVSKERLQVVTLELETADLSLELGKLLLSPFLVRRP